MSKWMTMFQKRQQKNQNHRSGSNRTTKNASSLSTWNDKKKSDLQVKSSTEGEMVWRISEENEERMTGKGERTDGLK